MSKKYLRLEELEPLIFELKKDLLRVKPLVSSEDWEANIKRLAEELIETIITSYVDSHISPDYLGLEYVPEEA